MLPWMRSRDLFAFDGKRIDRIAPCPVALPRRHPLLSLGQSLMILPVDSSDGDPLGTNEGFYAKECIDIDTEEHHRCSSSMRLFSNPLDFETITPVHRHVTKPEIESSRGDDSMVRHTGHVESISVGQSLASQIKVRLNNF